MNQLVAAQATREERIKNLGIAAIFVTIGLFCGLWCATQAVAADCAYDRALGSYWQIQGLHIYPPFAYILWCMQLGDVIPAILSAAEIWIYGGAALGFAGCMVYIKQMRPDITHGSARWATKSEIKKAGLADNSGVILGINPYTRKFLRDDGPTHIFLMAPTRSGKGVGVIIPTLLTWTHSVFVTDVKGENWTKSAGYRQKAMQQKCIKFAPLEADGSSARWNPMAEIRMKTLLEGSDIETLAGMLVDPYGQNKAGDYWPQAGKVLLKGALLHHLYWYEKEGRPLPNLTNVLTFLSNIGDALPTMACYPHISPEDFLEDRNIFQECYGDAYITDFTPYKEAFSQLFKEEVHISSLQELKAEILRHSIKKSKDARRRKAVEKAQQEAQEALQLASEAKAQQQNCVTSAAEYTAAIKAAKKELKNSSDETRIKERITELAGELEANEQASAQLSRKIARLDEEAERKQRAWNELQQKYAENPEAAIDFEQEPWCYLLVHPKVRECAQSMLDKAPAEMSGVQSTVLTALNLYQDPVIQRNTAVSDFCITDLLQPEQAVSFYLVIPPNDLKTLTPLVRILINMMFNRLIRDMKDEHVKGCKRQRLLLMLDEFPQFGKLDTIDQAMAVCASYGIKMCIVSQNIKQLFHAYGKDQSIMANCHTQVYFTPNQDGGETAAALSRQLGKTTITSKSRNDGGGGFLKGSNTTNVVARDLMTPDEVAQFPYEKEIVMVAGTHPIYGNKLMYFKDKRFLARSYSPDKPYYPPPVFSDICTTVDSFQRLHENLRTEFDELHKKSLAVERAKEAAAEAASWSVVKPTKVQLAAKEKEDATRTRELVEKAQEGLRYHESVGWYEAKDAPEAAPSAAD